MPCQAKSPSQVQIEISFCFQGWNYEKPRGSDQRCRQEKRYGDSALLLNIHVHIFSLDVQSKSVGEKLSSLYFHWNGISDTFAFSLNSWILFLVASNYYERYGKRERQSTGKKNIFNNVILVSVPDSTCQLRLLLVTSLTGSNQRARFLLLGKVNSIGIRILKSQDVNTCLIRVSMNAGFSELFQHL